MRTLLVVGILVGIGLVFWLSWLPNPDIGDVLPVPSWLRHWINVNGNFRTAIPFLFLGFFAEFILYQQHEGWKYRGGALLVLVGVVIIAEVGQLWLPRRHFGWWDIVYGGLGAAGGIYFAKGLLWAKQHFTKSDKKLHKVK